MRKVDRHAAYRHVVRPRKRRPGPAQSFAGALRRPRPYPPFPPLLVVFAPAPRRAVPETREAEFLARAAAQQSVRLRRLAAATTTLERLTEYGPAAAVWRVAREQDGYWTLDGLPAAR